MELRFDYGDAVRVVRNVRNDGTYPGKEVGALLIRRGSVGHVVNVGAFLQDQVIYAVHFLDAGRMVGCRAEELIPAGAPWNPSRYDFRDQVKSRLRLAVEGEIIVERGMEGEVLKVIRESENIQYHVRFSGRTLQVPEHALDPAGDAVHPGEENSKVAK